jgi:DNA-binding MltR family transcriptional regulator
MKDWPGFQQEFANESDRAAAVLGAAWLDVRLRLLLESFLVDDAKVVSVLFDSHGPLQTFADRIRMSYSLGLISRVMFEDLTAIKDIRNEFAHDLHDVTFGDPRIASVCAQLQTPKPILERIQDPTTNPRKLHEMTVALLANLISRNAERARKERRTVKDRDR